jgi:hypothetical protein
MMFAVYLFASSFFLVELVAFTCGSSDLGALKPYPSFVRGGASDNDLELDTFIESLIADVSDSNDEHHSSLTSVQDSQSTTDSVEVDAKKKKRKKHKVKNKSKSVTKSDALPTTENEKVNKKDNDEEVIALKETYVAMSEHKSSLGNNEISHDLEQSPYPERVGRPIYPPNVLQQFLLSQGFIGRVLASLTVLFSEVIHKYLPEVYMLMDYLSPGRTIASERGIDRQAREGVHSQYAAFASGSTVGGKKLSKDQKKRMDAAALTKLKHVKGGVKSGKYAYLSSSFMKRYNLGKYAEEAKIYQSIIAPIQVSHVDEDTFQIDTDDELDTEVEDWVVQALLENNSEKISDLEGDIVSSTQPLSSVSTGTSRSSGMGGHLSRVVKKRQMSVIDAARGSKVVTKARKDLRIKSSDKDGGGGVLGRLRAATASSGMSSRLLGAYPGDAVPITDAASRYGVIELAKRYGYGDWDSDDDDDEIRNGGNHKKKHRKTRKRPKSSGRNHTSNSLSTSDDSSGLSVSFELGLSSPSSKSQTRLKRKSTTPIATSSIYSHKTETDLNVLADLGYRNRARESWESNQILLSQSSSQKVKGKPSNLKSWTGTEDRTRVRRPMERTYESFLQDDKSPTFEQNDRLGLSMKQRSTPVRAPMKRVRDHHNDKDDGDNDPLPN